MPKQSSKLNINTDNLVLILERLYDDKESLISCLSVSKLWCQTSLKILWEDPWTSFLNEDKLEKAKPFFKTILSQLPEDSKRSLAGRSIKIERRKPLFDYVSHIRYIKHTYSADGKKDNDIYDYVFSQYNENQRIELKKEIYRFFFKTCTSPILIELTNFNYKLLHDFPGIDKNLSNLKHLRFDDKFSQVIGDLTEICRQIEKFDINLTCSNPTRLSEFIRAQTRLKTIIIRDNVNENNSLEKQYGTVGDAIVEKKYLIIQLDLTVENNVSFYNNLFTKLTNLRKLVLYDSRYRNVTVHKQLKFETYPKLQVLQIGISFSVAVKIIQATKNTIQAIWLDKGNQESEEQIAQLIRSITENCQSLKYLKTYLKNENLEDFKQLLLNCKELEGLYIYRGSIYNDDDGKKLLDVLASAAQNNLYKFQLHYCYFKIDTLNNFFKKWKGKKGRKPLYLYPILANYYEKRQLSKEEFNRNKKRFNDMIEKYRIDNTIRMFENSKDFTFINDFEI